MASVTVYERTQRGTVIRTVTGLIAGVGTLLTIMSDEPVAAAIVVTTGLTLFVLFGSMTVRVTADRLELSLGLGLIRKRLKLAEVTSWRTHDLAWVHGYGIRYLAGCCIYRVSGTQGVELQLQDGVRWYLGSAEPQALYAALAQAKSR